MGLWGVYVLECRDGTLYCGATNDLDARLRAHNAGTGAKYTRGRRPVTLAGFSGYRYTQGEALRIERIVKCLPRQGKVAYVQVYRKKDLPTSVNLGQYSYRPLRIP